MRRVRAGGHCTGYTLLEMIVVLVIIGLTLGLTGTWLFSFIGTWRANVHRDTVLGEIQHLPIGARETGHGFTVAMLPTTASAAATQALPLVHLPSGWNVRFNPPLRIWANGACSSTRFVLGDGKRRWSASVEAPYCATVLDNDVATR